MTYMQEILKKLGALNLALVLLAALVIGAAVPAYAEGGTITYYGSGGTTATGAYEYIQTVESFDNVTLLGYDIFNPRYEGQLLLYWRDQYWNTYSPGQSYNLSSGIYMTAVWGNARVTYYGNGGLTAEGKSSFEEYVVYSYGYYNDGSAFLREGHVFTGWNTKADGTGDWYQVGTRVPSGAVVTLYAQWQEFSSDKWLRYCANGTDLFSGKSYEYEVISSFPAEAKLRDMPGDYAIGWGRSSSSRYGTEPLIYAPGSTIEVDSNTTLYACQVSQSDFDRWPYIAAVYDGNGGESSIGSTVMYNSVSYGNLTLYGAGTFARPGMYLRSWNTQPDGSGQKYEFNQVLSLSEYKGKIVRLYAQWEKGADKFITYVGNGGTTVTGSSVYYQEVSSYEGVTLVSADIFGREDAQFIGWKDQQGDWYFEGRSYDFDGQTILEAQWGEARITYHGNGGSGAYGNKEQVSYITSSRDTVLKEVPFTNSEHAFVGWNTKADGTGTWYAAGSSAAGLGRVELYAQWQELPSGNWLRYAANGSGILDGKTYNYQTVDTYPCEITLPEMQDNENYAFVGWGTSTSVPYGQEPLVYAPGSTIKLSENITLYALYISKSIFDRWIYIAAIYDGNGGESSIGSTVKSNSVSWGDLTLYGGDAFQKEGYKLVSWNTEPNGSGTEYELEQVLPQSDYGGKAVRLYAQWEFDPNATHRLNFGEISVPETAKLFVALYDEDGRMFGITQITATKGYALADILSTDYLKMDCAKLFILNGSSCSPIYTERTISRYKD